MVHIWDGTDIVADVKGSTTTVYFRGINLIFSEMAGVRTYYHQNAHGDVIMLTDGQGNIIKTYEYDAFGVEWDAVDTDNNPFRYCGEYFDKETKTVYLRARYYDSAYGRFTQQDGWEYANYGDPLSLNLYTYCWNNPVKYVDYTGEFPTIVMNPIINLFHKKYNDYWKNYEHNSVTYTGSGYIHGQAITDGVKDCRLGFQKMSKNGCEAIALYNAMIAMGTPQKLADVVAYCESHMWLMGYFGTHWEAIPEYIDSQPGMSAILIGRVEDYDEALARYGYAIFTFWNNKDDITAGIHTVLVEYESEERIYAYNYYDTDTDRMPFKNMTDLIDFDNGEAIQFVGIYKHSEVGAFDTYVTQPTTRI